MSEDDAGGLEYGAEDDGESLEHVGASDHSSEEGDESTPARATSSTAIQPAPSSDLLADESLEERNVRLRLNVIEELIATEDDYVRDVDIIMTRLRAPLLNSSFLPKEDFQALFGNLHIIAPVNKQLLLDLRRIEKQPDRDRMIGKAFLELADYFRMYTQYCVAGGTSVLLDDGFGVPVESLTQNSPHLLSGCPAPYNELTPSSLSAGWRTGLRECVSLTLEDGRALTLTPEHLILQPGGVWTPACMLTVGSVVQCSPQYPTYAPFSCSSSRSGSGGVAMSYRSMAARVAVVSLLSPVLSPEAQVKYDRDCARLHPYADDLYEVHSFLQHHLFAKAYSSSSLSSTHLAHGGEEEGEDVAEEDASVYMEAVAAMLGAYCCAGEHLADDSSLLLANGLPAPAALLCARWLARVCGLPARAHGPSVSLTSPAHWVALLSTVGLRYASPANTLATGLRASYYAQYPSSSIPSSISSPISSSSSTSCPNSSSDPSSISCSISSTSECSTLSPPSEWARYVSRVSCGPSLLSLAVRSIAYAPAMVVYDLSLSSLSFLAQGVVVHNCATQEAAVRALTRLRGVPEFVTFTEAFMALPEARALTIMGFLIKPIQRLCKYPLLLRELLKYTSDGHPDKSNLANALEKVSQVVEVVNEKKDHMETMERIFAVMGEVDGLEQLQLVKPGQRLLLDLPMQKLQDKKGGRWRDARFLLFRDMLVFARPCTIGKSLMRRGSTIAGLAGGRALISKTGAPVPTLKPPQSESNKPWAVKGTLALSARVALRDLEEDNALGFELVEASRTGAPPRVVSVLAPDRRARAEWVAALREALRRAKPLEGQPLLGRQIG